MKLVSLSVQNYRSIIKSSKLPIKNSTILIGPNNEGKSNILKALVTVLTFVSRSPRISFRRTGKTVKRVIIQSHGFRRAGDYDWDRDFPISLQSKHPEGISLF